MPPSLTSISVLVASAAAYLGLVFLVHRALASRARLAGVLVAFRWLAAALTVAAYVAVVHGVTVGRHRWPGLPQPYVITKIVIALVAAAAAFFDRARASAGRVVDSARARPTGRDAAIDSARARPTGRDAAIDSARARPEGRDAPISERVKRVVGLGLGAAAIVAYFNGFQGGLARFYHQWDQYHYYIGSKYFRELGYDGLYKCAVIAQDEIGVVRYASADRVGQGPLSLDMSREARAPEKKIRDLGGDNLLFPASEVLEHPEECKDRFSAERWEQYKRDVTYFRLAVGKQRWEDMQHDHGYNPPPVWTVGGHALASLFPPYRRIEVPLFGTMVWPQILAGLDLAYGAAMFGALFWAFGWRVAAVAAVFWGCQASAAVMWTQGAFLRQDWLFWLVFSACLAKKRWPALAGAAMVYAGLLRVFPFLAVVGWLAVTAVHVYRHRSFTRPQRRMIAGGAIAFATLVPLSLAVAGAGAYRDFYEHTLTVHDRTPLTNHMGLRVLVSQKVPFEIRALGIGVGPSSGRMKYVQNHSLADPFETWKSLRNARADRLRPVTYGVVALYLAWMILVARRLPSMWAAGCLGQVFMILGAQLTCYYYVFMILLAPLTRARPKLEIPIFGFVILTQIVDQSFKFYDDRFWVQTFLSLAISSFALFAFTPRVDREAMARIFSPLTSRGAA